MKRINIIALIIIHSLLAILTIITNTIIIDMLFMAFTFILLVKLLSLAKHFCLDYVKDNECGEF